MVFDVGIIGCGVAGSFAAVKIAEKYKKCSCVVFDIGRPPQKRRRQLEGFLGCFPTGNGKLYPNDIDCLFDLMDGRKVIPAYKWVMKYFKEVNPMKLNKDSKPKLSAIKRIRQGGFELQQNNYFQWKPESVHKLSKLFSEKYDKAKNITFCFDNEVKSFSKYRKKFIISTENGEFTCNKLILCVGRSGWRWVTNLYKQFGIVADDDWATYGIRLEMPANALREFNKSHCILYKDNLEIGPFNWAGTIIPEDHSDLVISAFRSNEDRWRSEKVSFSLLKSIYHQNDGCAQADRIGKLSFLLSNDRVSREKVSSFLNRHSLLSLLPEYSWLYDTLFEIEKIIPNICTKGYYHIPHISPMPAKIRLGDNLESEIENMFVAGEAAGIYGIMGAAVSGVIAANSACG